MWLGIDNMIGDVDVLYAKIDEVNGKLQTVLASNKEFREGMRGSFIKLENNYKSLVDNLKLPQKQHLAFLQESQKLHMRFLNELNDRITMEQVDNERKSS